MGKEFTASSCKTMGVLLLLLVSTTSADILFRRPIITLPTLPTFSIFPTGSTTPSGPSSSESSEITTSGSPPPPLPPSSGSTIVPIITGLPTLDGNLVDPPSKVNGTTAEIPSTTESNLAPDEEMLAQKILNSLQSIEKKLDQVQQQLNKQGSTLAKLGGEEEPHHLPTITSPPPLIRPGGSESAGENSGSPLSGLLPTLPLPGGFPGRTKPKDDTVTGLVEKLKPEIHTKVCEKQGAAVCGALDTFGIEVIEYKKQVVAGANYFVKAKTNDENEWHLKIFHQSWTKTLQLSDIQGPVQKGQEITYF